MRPIELLHHLVNHPDIIRWVAPGQASVDVQRFDVKGAWVCGDTDGGVLFLPATESPGYYEIHYLFTEAVRGKQALTRIRYAIEVMFTRRGAAVICGAVPREHRASRMMTRALGFGPVGTHTDASGRACILYALERKSWAASSAVS